MEQRYASSPSRPASRAVVADHPPLLSFKLRYLSLQAALVVHTVTLPESERAPEALLPLAYAQGTKKGQEREQ